VFCYPKNIVSFLKRVIRPILHPPPAEYSAKRDNSPRRRAKRVCGEGRTRPFRICRSHLFWTRKCLFILYK